MRIRITFLFMIALAADCLAASYNYHISLSSEPDEFIIVVHGLRGNSRVFAKMEKTLLVDGFSVCRVDYPSTRDSLAVMSETVISEAVRRCEQAGAKKLHFVAHSMGAILVRHYLQNHDVLDSGRVVFLSPPNHGTALVDKFRWSWFFRKINGPGGMQLGSAPDAFIQSLHAPDYEVGVIMSTKSINPFASAFIPGKDDGRVPIESAKIEGMKDFALVACNHHVIMKKEKTIRFVGLFLQNGTFD
jgi:triacylglycerol lipase